MQMWAQAYWNGRFTNQPGNWVDYMDTNDTSTATRNFAYGGAAACDYPERTAPPPGLDIPSIKTQAVKLLDRVNNQPGYKERLMGTGGNRPITSLVRSHDSERMCHEACDRSTQSDCHGYNARRSPAAHCNHCLCCFLCILTTHRCGAAMATCW
jgi:hypothetical protein